MSQKVSCCLIVKDEISTIRELLEQLRPHVDEIVVVDTGSTDGTLEACREIADKVEVYTDCNDANGMIVDFSAARNRCLELATHDWVVWFDGDDRVEGAENIRRMAIPNPDREAIIYMMQYEYDHDGAGNCTTLQLRERMVWPRKKFRWQYPIHELLVPDPPIADEKKRHVYTEGLRVIHRRMPGKKREGGRNLRILEDFHRKVGDGDLRTLFYLGQELAAAGRVGEAMRCLKKYCARSDWADERCLAELLIARLQLEIGDCDEAIVWADKAKASKSWSGPWFVLSRAYFIWAIRGIDAEYNFRRSASMAEIGLHRPPERTVLFFNPMERHEIHTTLSVCYGALSQFERALASCEEGLKHLPNNQQLLENKQKFQTILAKRAIRQNLKTLVDNSELSTAAYQCVDAILKSGRFSPAIPDTVWKKDGSNGIDTHGSVVGSSDSAGAGTTGGQFHWDHLPDSDCLRIAIYVGHQLEPWTPKTLDENGMGGSETMAWLMARGLRKKGHSVAVFGHCDKPDEFDGVQWHDAADFKNVDCDVLISSRKVEVLDDPSIRATASFLWVHDVHVGGWLTRRREMNWDRYLCLSKWHKQFFVNFYLSQQVPIDPDKVIVTRNGIELSRFSGIGQRMIGQRIHRDHDQAVYSSSPDRGLEIAVRHWHKVRERVPYAQLHVYYGFDNWRRSAEMSGDKDSLTRIDKFEKLVQSTDGVVLHGRINRFDLAKEFLRSGVFAYSTWFSETSCIGAMEAQAAGLHIVTSPIAALPETVGGHGVFIRHDPGTKEYADAWVDAVVDAMLNPDDSMRAHAMNDAQRFDINTLVDEWDAMIRDVHSEMKERVVPQYTPAPEAAQ